MFLIHNLQHVMLPFLLVVEFLIFCTDDIHAFFLVQSDQIVVESVVGVVVDVFSTGKCIFQSVQCTSDAFLHGGVGGGICSSVGLGREISCV